MVTFDEKEKYLNEGYKEAVKELVYYPSIMGDKYYEGNEKFYENLEMSQAERRRYIGKKVYAGSRMKGYYGIIVDVIPPEDGFPGDWFVVQEEKDPRHFEKWGKEELQQIIITTALAPLK